jgi:hypothetical protein
VSDFAGSDSSEDGYDPVSRCKETIDKSLLTLVLNADGFDNLG